MEFFAATSSLHENTRDKTLLQIREVYSAGHNTHNNPDYCPPLFGQDVVPATPFYWRSCSFHHLGPALSVLGKKVNPFQVSRSHIHSKM
jgi:hypothetical protein